MGLISRVSSRTYRSELTMRLARILKTYNLLPGVHTGTHHGLRPTMKPVRPNGLIQCSRYIAFFLGIFYGGYRLKSVYYLRQAEIPRELEARNKILEAEAAAALKAKIEFENDSPNLYPEGYKP